MPKFLQYGSALAVRLGGDGDEKVLRSDEFVLQTRGFLPRRHEDLVDARRGKDLLRLISQLGGAVERRINLGAYAVDIGAQFLDYIAHQPLFLGEQSHQQMLDVPLAVVVLQHQLLR